MSTLCREKTGWWLNIAIVAWRSAWQAFTLRPELASCQARFGLGYVSAIWKSGPVLNQVFNIIITLKVSSVVCSSVCHTSRWWRTCSGMWAALSTTWQSWAQLASILEWPSVNVISCNQPELSTDIFASVTGPMVWLECGGERETPFPPISSGPHTRIHVKHFVHVRKQEMCNLAVEAAQLPWHHSSDFLYVKMWLSCQWQLQCCF